jgi:Ca2+-binding RTX toxin-like protein
MMHFPTWLDALRHRIRTSNVARRRKAVRPARPAESLEERVLLTVSSLMVNGELNITGDGDDVIEVRVNPIDGVSLQVIQNSLSATTVQGFRTDQVTSINIRAGSGHSRIDLSAVTNAAFPNIASGGGIIVNAGDGNDTIIGSADLDDTIFAGDGNDSIFTGSGVNRIDGGDGHDTIDAGAGADIVDGGDGDDLISGNDGNDLIDAGDGFDAVSGNNGDDTIDGGESDDIINGNDGNDSIVGGFGNDIVNGDLGDDSVRGSAGNDILSGGDGDDKVIGNSGHDRISGGNGNDTLEGDNHNDTISGDAGDDLIRGDHGDDSISGGDGDDNIFGGQGRDVAEGNDGDDSLNGNGGNDTLRGNSGMDRIKGGDGSDRLEGDSELTAPPVPGVAARLFAVPVDGSAQFVELDPATGAEVFRFNAPQAFSGNRDGLAFNGSSLFSLSGDGTNILYEIDPNSMTIIDADPVTAGSRTYDGLASLGGLVFVLDPVSSDIHVYDPTTDSLVNTLDINAINPTIAPLAGGLAAIAGPDRLVVTEAGGSRVLEIDPLTGIVTSQFTPATPNAGQYFGAAVVGGQIYLGSGSQALIDVFSRQGIYIETLTLPYSVSALGGDDPGTATINPGQNPADVFDIDVRFSGTFTQSQQDTILAAAQRWEQIIIGDVPDVFVPGFGQVDDIVIELRTGGIDGPSGVVAETGLFAARVGSRLPSAAFVQFDTSDLLGLEQSGLLGDTVLHEMGHALGFGSIWDDLGLLAGAGSSNPQFLGQMAVQEYNLRFGTSVTGVPVENMGGAGTADSHWRETVLGNELMTGFLDNGNNPITRLTIAQFADLGYQVDMTQADILNMSSFSLSGGRALTTGGTQSVSLSVGRTQLLNLTPMLVYPGLDARKVESLTAEEYSALVSQQQTTKAIATSNRLVVSEVEPNNTFPSAVSIDSAGFSLSFDPNITDAFGTNTSTTIPNLSIQGTGDGSFDYYTFTVTNAGDRGIFDIDFGANLNNQGVSVGDALDARLFLFDAAGNELRSVDDVTFVDSGSSSILDAFLEVTFAAPGTYVIAVADGSAISTPGGGLSGQGPGIGTDYTLQVSIQNHATTAATPATPTNVPIFGDILIGGRGNGRGQGDLIFGSPGDDRIIGSNENDTIMAGDGQDRIDAGTGNDDIDAGGGNDMITGELGDDTINGGGGDDRIDWAVNDGNDSIVASDGLDTINIDGSHSNESFTISGTGDVLGVTWQHATVATQTSTISIDSGTLVVNVDGRKGDDTFTVGSLQQVHDLLLNLLGNEDNDTFDLSASDTSSIRLTVDSGEGDDILTGSAGEETLNGGSGNDVINGGGGNDVLNGNDGDDTLNGGDGNDVLDGGNGNDLLSGGIGNDTLNGGQNNDTLNGEDGNDSLDGEQGADVLNGGDGADIMFGGDGNDRISGGLGADFAHGGADNDRISGDGGDDTIRGGDGNDEIDAGDGDDVVNGGDGNDVISGKTGNDLLDGGDGNDLISGDSGNDVVTGGDGRDLLHGDSFGLVGTAISNVRPPTVELNVSLTLHDGTTVLVGKVRILPQASGANTSNTSDNGTLADLIQDVNAALATVSYNGQPLSALLLAVDAGGNRIAIVVRDFSVVASFSIANLRNADRIGLDTLQSAATLSGTLAGSDTILGGDDNDTLFGDGGADTLAGNDGSDEINRDVLDTIDESFRLTTAIMRALEANPPV